MGRIQRIADRVEHPDFKQKGAVIAFVLVAAAAAVGINASAQETAQNSAAQIRVAAVNECKRADMLRKQLAERQSSNNTMRAVLIQFLDAASKARQANYAASHLRADLKAAEQYAYDAHVLQTSTSPFTWKRINCKKEFGA